LCGRRLAGPDFILYQTENRDPLRRLRSITDRT
jgi:hypothetical protein